MWDTESQNKVAVVIVTIKRIKVAVLRYKITIKRNSHNCDYDAIKRNKVAIKIKM